MKQLATELAVFRDKPIRYVWQPKMYCCFGNYLEEPEKRKRLKGKK